jgi:predicted HTH transcriptional regulator
VVHYINKLIEEGEHQRLDFKFEISDSRKIAKSLVAFANTDGGTLLVGVKDNGKIAGVRTDEEAYMIEAAASMYCKPKVEIHVRKWNVEGKAVLEVMVPKSPLSPHYAEASRNEWLVFIRVKDENILANSVHLKVWERKRQKQGVFIEYSEKEKFLLQYLEEHSAITISRFCKIALITRKTAENILANLISLGVVEMFFIDGHFEYRLLR